MKTGMQNTFTATLVLAVVALTGLAGCAEKSTETSGPRPVAWTEVVPYDEIEARQLPGLVHAAQQAPLGFEVPGRVAVVNVDIGEKFNRGDVLAQLDARNFRLALAERQANLADARARHLEAGKTLDRKLELEKRGVGSQAAVDSARAARDSAQAQVSRLQALVNLAREDMADTDLKAPYDGEILQRHIEPSQQVRVGETVFEIQGDEGDLEVRVSVPETVVGRLQIGAQARVSFPARAELELDARVSEVGAGAIERNAFPVTLVLPAPPDSIRPGMTAEVRFALSSGGKPAAGLLAIPVTAFLAGDEQTRTAFVFSEDGNTIHRRSIEIADIRGELALISGGLSTGEVVASKGLAYLKDGQAVEKLDVGVARFQP